MKKTAYYILLSTILFSSCADKKKQEGLSMTFDMNMEHKMLNLETIRDSGAHGGTYYSSVDSVKQYGAGYSTVLPDSLKNKHLTICVSAWVREKELPFEGEIAIDIESSKGNKAWVAFPLKNKSAYKPGEWVQIIDSAKFDKAVLNEPFIDVRIFGMKNKGKDMLDVDDLKIEYKFSN